MAPTRFSARAAVVLFVVGCGSPPRPYGIQRLPAADPQQPATGAFWVFADTHIHAESGAATRLKSAFVDSEISSVAIRPPSLDLWAEVVVSEVRKRFLAQAPDIPAFFLGDAADVSCIDEYDRFLAAVGSDLVWFGTIGNHDGHYMGNFTFEPRGAIGENSWQGSCARDGVQSHRPWPVRDRLDRLERALWRVDAADQTQLDQGVLTKTHAIWMYLDQLHRRNVITEDPLDCDHWIPEGWNPQTSFTCAGWTPGATGSRVFRATGSYRIGSQTRSVSLVAMIDSATVQSPQRTQPWHAYLVQDIELSDRDHAILIDTSDYLNSPRAYSLAEALVIAGNWRTEDCSQLASATSLPGRCGEVGAAQAAQIASFVANSRRSRPGTRYFLMGHHPWRALRRDSTDRLTRLLDAQPGFVTYVSAHYHAATATLGTDAPSHWEINIGSTTDWPMQYAKISYWTSEPPRSPVVQVEVRPISRPHGAACPYGGPADPGAQPHARREMAYATPAGYVSRALEVYRIVLARIVGTSNDGAPLACSIDGTHTRLPDVLTAIDGVDPADLQAQRLLLDQIAECDRTVLRQIADVPRMEIGCAAWASKLEFDMHNRSERIPLSERAPEAFQIVGVPTGAPR